jgi:hypothetical protein
MIKLSLQTKLAEPEPAPINKPERKPTWAITVYVALASAAIGLLIGFSIGKPGPERIDDGRQVVDPDKSERKSTNKVEAAGSVFVFVYEFQTKTADQELLVRDLRAWSMINKCDFRQFDQDSKDAEPYKVAAEKSGLKSPFLAVVRDKKIVRVFDFPRDRLALESLVK